MTGTFVDRTKRDERASGVTKRIIETVSGERLRVASYTIPSPSYKHGGCSPSSDGVKPEDLLRGAWASCLENEHWRAILDQLCHGLGRRILGVEMMGLDPTSAPGGELRGFLHHAQRQGIVPILMRACEIGKEAGVEKFVASMRDPDKILDMANLCKDLTKKRTRQEDRDLARRLRVHGVRLALAYEQTTHLTARRNLRRMIRATSGFG